MNFDFYDIENMAVVDAFAKAEIVLRRHKNIMVSVSGGSDSDIVIDIIERAKNNIKNCCEELNIKYVFFDTGIEYDATKRHLIFLEKKYGIKIHIEKAIKPIPTCVREYGVPFLSKQVSEQISRLQKWGFKWEDEPFEVLQKKISELQIVVEMVV